VNADIRVGIDFADHPKTKRLIRTCGEEAVRCLLRLWSWSSISRPSGDLSDLLPEEIEDQARWKGASGVLYAALTHEKSRFIDEKNGKIFLHEWKKHNPWAATASERQRIARKAAKARWDKRKKAMLDAMHSAPEEHCGEDAKSNAPIRSLPVRSSPSKGKATLSGNGDAPQPTEGASGPPPSDEEIERAEYESLKPHIQKQCTVLMSHFGIQSSFDPKVHKGSRFHPVGFVHYARSSAIPARVIVKVLDSMVRQKGNIANPYGWLTSVLASEHKEYNYTEELKEHERRKRWGLRSIGSFLRGGSSR
jgi:hypothetical protein